LAAFLAETSNKKLPEVSDRFEIRSVLKQYHTITKVKAGVSQFLDGLNTMGVLQMIRQHSDLMKAFLVPTENIRLCKVLECTIWKFMLTLKITATLRNSDS